MPRLDGPFPAFRSDANATEELDQYWSAIPRTSHPGQRKELFQVASRGTVRPASGQYRAGACHRIPEDWIFAPTVASNALNQFGLRHDGLLSNYRVETPRLS